MHFNIYHAILQYGTCYGGNHPLSCDHCKCTSDARAINCKTMLTLYHTIPTFNDPKKEGFCKHYGKKRKMLVTSSFSFCHVFYPLKGNLCHLMCPLTHYQTTKFRLFHTERVCRRQFQI